MPYDRSKILLCGLFVAGLYAAQTIPLLLVWPAPWPDESYFAEPARVLSESGVLRSDFILAMDDHVYWQPPGYFFFLALMLKVMSYDLEALRLVSILVGACIVGVVGDLAWKISHRRWVALLAMVVLVVNPNFTTYVKLVRMDGLCMLLQMIGVALLLRSQMQYRSLHLIGAGFCFAGGLLFHPLGMIGLCIGIAQLFLDRRTPLTIRLRESVLLCLPILLVLVVIGIAGTPDTSVLWKQMAMQLSRKARSPWDSGWNFIIRYRTIPLFILLVFWSLVVWKKRKLWTLSANHATLLFAVAASALVVALMFELAYHIYVLPWISIGIAEAFHESYESSEIRQRRILITGLAIVGLSLVAYPSYFIYHFHFSDQAPERSAEVFARAQSHIPLGGTTLLCGYPDSYWYLRETRPDLKLVSVVVFNDEDRRQLRARVTHVVIARLYEPHSDSVSLFTEARLALGLTVEEPLGTILAQEGLPRHFYPSVWIVERTPRRSPGEAGPDQVNKLTDNYVQSSAFYRNP